LPLDVDRRPRLVGLGHGFSNSPHKGERLAVTSAVPSDRRSIQTGTFTHPTSMFMWS
jgi:hypothetical protein